MNAPKSLYTDGGVIGSNPSPYGGTWAFAWVDEDNKLTTLRSGIVDPKQAGVKLITNNYTELLAAIMALESVPEGWEGLLYTDSEITQYRVCPYLRGCSFNGIPKSLMERALAARKTRDFIAVLVSGHPTKSELEKGQSRSGRLVSQHNVVCDKRCKELAQTFMRSAVRKK